MKKRNIYHPNFITGLVSYLLLLIGVVLKGNQFYAGEILIAISIVAGGVHWVRSLIDVVRDKTLKKEGTSRYFWFAIIIMIPPVAGMMYYIMRHKKIAF